MVKNHQPDQDFPITIQRGYPPMTSRVPTPLVGQETAEAKARREREDLEEQTRAGAPDGSLKDLMVKNAWDFRAIQWGFNGD